MNHVTKQGFYKMLCEKNSVFGEVSVLLVLIQFQFQSHCHSSGWGWGGRLFVFDWEGEGGGVGWTLIRGWALINFFCLRDGRLIEVGANSRLGAYSNK